MSVQAADALMAVFGFERATLRGDGESGTTEDNELEVVMSDKMREEFEARFPVPWGLEFDDEKYVAKMPHYDRFIAERHNAMFEAWVASRAALVVELPKIVDSEWACSSLECSFIKDGVRLTRLSIHAAGVSTR